nr:PREDICTED: SUMO-interacting motif-containing protein 1 isoform X1 [Lepisosteus oculatus]
MAEIIDISSGSDEDSDVEILDIFNDGKNDTEPCLVCEESSTYPICIDLTENACSTWAFAIHDGKRPGPTVELVGLRESSPMEFSGEILNDKERVTVSEEIISDNTPSTPSSLKWDELEMSPTCSPIKLACSDPCSPTLSPCRFPKYSQFKLPNGELPLSQDSKESEKENKESLACLSDHTPDISNASESFGAGTHCYSSDGDLAVFSDASNMEEADGKVTYSGGFNTPHIDYFPVEKSLHDQMSQKPQQSPQNPTSATTQGTLQSGEQSSERFCCDNNSVGSPRNHTASPNQDNQHFTAKQDDAELPCAVSPLSNEMKDGEPRSPTSTEILAGDSPDWLQDDADLPSNSPTSECAVDEMEKSLSSSDNFSSRSPLLSPELEESGSEDSSGSDSEQGTRDTTRQERHYVHRTELKRLKLLTGMPLQDLFPGKGIGKVQEEEREYDPDLSQSDDDEDDGTAQPICHRSLRLVHTTMEENYPEGTLQFVLDFLHPCFYPTGDIVSHVLRKLLLESQSSIRVTEAYNLLMKIQQLHPAKQSTVQWDWELLSSAMDEKKHPPAVLSMLLHYVLQTLEDDFHRRVTLQELHRSIVKATLSCDRKFANVRDVVNWLTTAVMNSTAEPEVNKRLNEEDTERKQDRDNYLKIVFLLQKMLALAIEVDRSPTCSSSKLSREMFHTLVNTVPHRHHRLQLLKTMESKLLQCKLLELLLDHACPQKTTMPMSLSLLLHFLQNTELPLDPTDGNGDRWLRWNELLEMLFMLFVSYGEVLAGHLRYSITERARSGTAPIKNDRITQAAVQEAADAFCNRVARDLGEPLNSQLEQRIHLLQSLLQGAVTKEDEFF